MPDENGAGFNVHEDADLWSFWIGGGNLTAAPALAGDETLYTPGSSSPVCCFRTA